MFTYKRKAQYHETDQMGIIHHSNYIKWMEEARIAFMDEIGMGYSAVEESAVFSPVVSISADYKKPVHFADDVEITLSVSSYTGVKLEMSYSFYNKTREEICTVALSKHCFIRNGKIISLKKEMPELDEKIRLNISE